MRGEGERKGEVEEREREERTANLTEEKRQVR